MNNSNGNSDMENTISPLDIFLVLAKHWRLIFFTTLVSAALIFGYSIYTLKAPLDSPINFIRNFYRPYVLIRVQGSESASSSVLSQTGLGTIAGLAGVSSGGTSNAELSMALLEGNTIIDQVVEEFDLINVYEIGEFKKTKSREKVKIAIEPNYNENTGILRISYTDEDPILATNILSRLVDLLEERFKSLTMEKILNKKRFLEERLTQVEEQLETAQDNLIAFQSEHGIIDIVATTGESLTSSTKEFVFSEYIPRSKRYEISSLYFDLERDRSILDGIYELLMQQFETAKIEEMDDTRTFQIIERAEVPEKKAGPSRARICIIVTAVVLVLTILISFIIEYFSKVRRDPDEAKKLKEIKNLMFKRNRRTEGNK